MAPAATLHRQPLCVCVRVCACVRVCKCVCVRVWRVCEPCSHKEVLWAEADELDDDLAGAQAEEEQVQALDNRLVHLRDRILRQYGVSRAIVLEGSLYLLRGL